MKLEDSSEAEMDCDTQIEFRAKKAEAEKAIEASFKDYQRILGEENKFLNGKLETQLKNSRRKHAEDKKKLRDQIAITNANATEYLDSTEKLQQERTDELKIRGGAALYRVSVIGNFQNELEHRSWKID